MAAAPPPAAPSSLEIVLGSLDRGAAASAGEESFLLLPLWNVSHGGAESQEIGDVSLRKITVLSGALASKNLRHFGSSSSSSSDGGLLFSGLVNDRVVQDQELRNLLKQKSRGISRRLVSTVLRWSVSVGFWDPVATLLECGLVSSNENPEIIDRIVEDGNVPLVLLCVLSVRDIRPSQWLEILKLFLANSKKFAKFFQLQRQVWHELVSNHIQDAVRLRGEISADGNQTEEFLARKREELALNVAACVNLAVAFDRFTASELCLHIFLSADHDEAVLTAIVSEELDTSQVSILLRYLNKWLEVFSSKMIHAREMDQSLVPSLQTIIRWISTILEIRYASLVIARDLSKDLGETAGLVSSLLAVGGKMRSMEGVLQHLISRTALPGEKLGVQSSEHIIEYLEIS
ncbi:hypothetical protein SELMODRAFT_403132 [Selaginella moellendorffii]|uniref:Uncharacterized protein n=1 Tax=Selaginella moellendorffii TaxID=88036 RepID=D8QP58_SELML|nr:hypothetical protein SELMODRAFT_403132 [Selaginella moellendorffii]